MYYLHITGTSEEVCFLPDTGENRLFELEYIPKIQAFSHPCYDRRAERILEKMQREGKSEEQLMEARRCLRLGIVRSDWLREPEEIAGYIKGARYAGEKNYWICMKKMADEKYTGG
jgi:hypothetical protein